MSSVEWSIVNNSGISPNGLGVFFCMVGCDSAGNYYYLYLPHASVPGQAVAAKLEEPSVRNANAQGMIPVMTFQFTAKSTNSIRFTLPASLSDFGVQGLISGRIYVGVGSPPPIAFAVDALTKKVIGYAIPNMNAFIPSVYDFVEYTILADPSAEEDRARRRTCCSVAAAGWKRVSDQFERILLCCSPSHQKKRFATAVRTGNSGLLSIDVTEVDQLGIPMTLGVQPSGCAAGPNQVGCLLARSNLFSSFSDYCSKTTAAKAFLACAIADLSKFPVPYRLLNPSYVVLQNPTSPLASYFDDAVSTFFSPSRFNEDYPLLLTATTGRSFSGVYATCGCRLGVPGEADLDGILFRLCSGDGCFFLPSPANPSVVKQYGSATYQTFACCGVFSNAEMVQNCDPADALDILRQVVKAFNDGTCLMPPSKWGNADAQYQPGTSFNYYAAFLHEHFLGGYAYGFPFDDSAGSIISTKAPADANIPSGVTISITPWS